eukprot:g14133.t1
MVVFGLVTGLVGLHLGLAMPILKCITTAHFLSHVVTVTLFPTLLSSTSHLDRLFYRQAPLQNNNSIPKSDDNDDQEQSRVTHGEIGAA